MVRLRDRPNGSEPDRHCLRFDVCKRRKKRNEMFRYADGADAGSTTAMWNAKGFVQIQMAHIGVHIARPAEADLGVHVGAIHVNLTAVAVHDLTNFANRCFEDAVCAWVCDH